MSEAKRPEWSHGPSGRVAEEDPPPAAEPAPGERPAGDALARLWQRADPSRGRHLEAIAELRERKRRERAAPSRSQNGKQDGDEQPGARLVATAPTKVPAPTPSGAHAAPDGERAPAPAAQAVLECERCGRRVEQTAAERVAIPSAVHEPVEHLLCSRCAGEVRQGLLRLLADDEPLPAEEPAPRPVAAAPEPAPLGQRTEPVPSSLAARLGWFLLRMAVYLVIALAAFALVSWLSTR